MPFFEDIVITGSMEITTAPEKIFSYLTGIVSDTGLKTLNKKNITRRLHTACRDRLPDFRLAANLEIWQRDR
jgi:hypothetical protein